MIIQNIWHSEVLEKQYFPDKISLYNPCIEETRSDFSNGPVSVLPSLSKIFERIIQILISFYIDEFLSPHLCGYRKDFSVNMLLHL